MQNSFNYAKLKVYLQLHFVLLAMAYVFVLKANNATKVTKTSVVWEFDDDEYGSLKLGKMGFWLMAKTRLS